MTDDFAELVVEGTEAYERIVEFAKELAPPMLEKIRLFEAEGSLFSQLGIEREIDRGAQEQGMAEIGRLHRDQPDRSAGGHRREYRSFCR